MANGWPIVGWATLALLAMIAGLLATCGANAAGIRLVIRATARTSFALFLAAFVASALRRALRTPTTAWLLANRRQLGVAFAASHGLHLLAIFALYQWSPRRFLDETGIAAVIVGGLGYVFVLAMAATSFDRTAAWLGPRRWRRLHTTGIYYLWTVFVISYVPRALASPAYAPLALTAIAALVLRLTYPRRRSVPGESRPGDLARVG